MIGQAGIRKAMRTHRFNNPCLSDHLRPYLSTVPSAQANWVIPVAYWRSVSDYYITLPYRITVAPGYNERQELVSQTNSCDHESQFTPENKVQFGTPFLQTTVIGKHVLQIRFRSYLELTNQNKHKRFM